MDGPSGNARQKSSIAVDSQCRVNHDQMAFNTAFTLFGKPII